MRVDSVVEPLTDEQLDEMTKAASLAAEHHDHKQRAGVEVFKDRCYCKDVPALVAEVRRLRARLPEMPRLSLCPLCEEQGYPCPSCGPKLRDAPDADPDGCDAGCGRKATRFGVGTGMGPVNVCDSEGCQP